MIAVKQNPRGEYILGEIIGQYQIEKIIGRGVVK
jgi:hypothetical protein